MSDRIIAGIPDMPTEKRAELRANCTAALNTPARRQSAAAILVALDAFEEQQERKRQAKLGAMSVAERIAHAFQQEPPTTRDERVIRTLLDHPGSTSVALSHAAGWKGQSWHLHFGTMCKERRHLLWPGPASEVRDAEFYSGILAEFDAPAATWRMKSEAIEAFAHLGIRSGKQAPPP